jgi:xanthine dehydrogenase YagT iron-sulfur-binding subunit
MFFLVLGAFMEDQPTPPPVLLSNRRTFLKHASSLAGLVALAPSAGVFLPARADTDNPPPAPAPAAPPPVPGTQNLTLSINGKPEQLQIEPRVTLLDALRDRLNHPGTKKGCDHGTCGACTVLIDGRRVLSCLTLAVTAQGREITTVEGLASGETLHPVQKAFIDCDGFQCGFCTSGQIMSAVACIKEGHTKSEGEIREWMSGNLCRCSAYPNIVEAVKQAAGEGGGSTS